jgi:hypothetical protein
MFQPVARNIAGSWLVIVAAGKENNSVRARNIIASRKENIGVRPKNIVAGGKEDTGVSSENMQLAEKRKLE